MSLTWLELPFDGGGGRGEGEGMAGFPHLPSLTRSVQIVLNNYPQRRKKKSLLNKSSTFVSSGAADRGPCLFSPPSPPSCAWDVLWL